MSYLHIDGKPDADIEILESARCFVVVISKILHPNEGMVVELPYQENYPDDSYGKYLVWKDEANAQIKVNKILSTDKLYQYESGQMIWVHNQIH
jgi:hypothetical protein